MNKTERMLAILLELQRTPCVTAQGLADKFELSVRTIYRDMQALSESGVPLFGSPGQGYRLMEGYFLPPVSLNANEAVALLIGTEFMKQYFGKQYTSEADTAGQKIESILPASIRDQSAAIRETVRLLGSHPSVRVDETTCIPIICEATVSQKQLEFGYTKVAASSDTPPTLTRIVDPYGMVLVRNCWMLVAYCTLRQEIRHFRLSRMTNLRILDSEFEWPEGFQFSEYRQRDDRRVLITLQVDRGVAARLREGESIYLERLEEQEGTTIATLRVRQLRDIIKPILGWGSSAVVLEPEELRTAIRHELQNMLKSY